MKHILSSTIATLALLATGIQAHAETSYTVFKVCEDQHVIRTSDGAEAGHVEYIVFDPAEQRIVSSIVSGGSVGEKFVAVPFSSMRFGPEREVVLTEITRERLVSAPVIERTQITTTARFEPTVVERSFTHFGVRVDATSRTTRIEDEQRRGGERRGDPAVTVQGQSRPGGPNAEADRKGDREPNADRERAGERERMARERQEGRGADRPDAGDRRGEGNRDRNRPSAEAAQDGRRSPAGEPPRENARAGSEKPPGNARPEPPDSAPREKAGAKPDGAPETNKDATRVDAPGARRSAREVNAEAAGKPDETTRGKADEAAKAKADGAGKAAEAARSAEGSAAKAAGAANEGTRKGKEPKAAEENRTPGAEVTPKEKKTEPKRSSGEDRSPQ